MLNGNLDNLLEFMEIAREDNVILNPPHVSYSQYHTIIENNDEKKLSEIKANALSLGKPNASKDIYELMKKCESIESEIKQKGSFIIPKIMIHDLKVIGL